MENESTFLINALSAWPPVESTKQWTSTKTVFINTVTTSDTEVDGDLVVCAAVSLGRNEEWA